MFHAVMAGIRINRHLAKSGICSRRKADLLIEQGRVSINGRLIRSPGAVVNPSEDAVFLDGRRVAPQENVYLALNKPRGVLCSAVDPFGRKTVFHFVKNINVKLHYAGRLDYDTSGLVILTNDGDISNKITHPKNMTVKRYTAVISGIPCDKALDKFRRGLMLDGRRTAPAGIKIIKKHQDSSIAEITIHEGRKRQIRRMCEAIGHPVTSLTRTAVGKIKLGGLEEGAWRRLSETELRYLENLPGKP